MLQGQWQCVGTVRVSGEFPKGPVEFSRSFSDYISDDRRSITLLLDISLRERTLGVFSSSLR